MTAGGNASGKSTTLKTILGIVRPTSGRVLYEGSRIDGLFTASINTLAMVIIGGLMIVRPHGLLTPQAREHAGGRGRRTTGQAVNASRKGFEPVCVSVSISGYRSPSAPYRQRETQS